MLKKLSIALLCLTMAVACIGCGDSKEDSSSKSESSATEVVTEFPTEEPTDAPTAEAELSANDGISAEDETVESYSIPEVDTAVVEEGVIGKWAAGYVIDQQGNVSTLNDYCEVLGVDPAEMQMTMEFKEDATVVLSSEEAGEENGTYTVDGAVIELLDSEGALMKAIYDPSLEMVLLDITGSGLLYIGFTM